MNASRSIISKATGFQSVLSSIQRKIATSAKEKCTEVEIKVPWGKVAGKLWNPNDSAQPILALHGWQDNAASFDKLVPLLPSKISVLAIDLPGHGLSSWLPEGTVYSKQMYLQVIHRIRQHFGWEKISLMGHSLGGMLCFSYTCLFSDDVKFVIALDFLKYRFHDVRVHAIRVAEELTNFLQLEESKQPSYGFTEEQIIARLIETTEESLDESASRTLMVRGVTKRSDGAVYANRDPRVKFLSLVNSMTEKCLEEQAQLVKSPFLLFDAKDWSFRGIKTNYHDNLGEAMKNCADFQLFKLPGMHHFHMTNPEPIAKLMIPFLEKYY